MGLREVLFHSCWDFGWHVLLPKLELQWFHVCSSPVRSGKYFCISPHLWFLGSFLSLFCNSPSLDGKGVILKSHSRLTCSHSLMPCSVRRCHSVYELPRTAKKLEIKGEKCSNLWTLNAMCIQEYIKVYLPHTKTRICKLIKMREHIQVSQ